MASHAAARAASLVFVLGILGGCAADGGASGPATAHAPRSSGWPEDLFREMKEAAGAQSWDRIQLQRTACYGTCPIYVVTLWRDGHATYSGKDHAPRRGEFQGKVDATSYGWLCFLIDTLDIAHLDADYSVSVTDLPTVIVSIWREPDGEPISIRDYGAAGPLALWGMQQSIDAVADEMTWLPAP